jgi:hypothetical protein
MVLFGCAAVCGLIRQPQPALAQSRPAAPASAAEQSAPGDPVAALREIVSAACAEDAEQFVRFLTVRNVKPFQRLNAASRVALMKRFVLLDEPGKPSVALNPSGRPTVRCQTPTFATEAQIGGAQLEENLAFVPLQVRGAGETESEAWQIQIGLVRENGQWKLLSAGLLLLDLPALETQWSRDSLDQNERDALQTLKRLAEAVEAYRRTRTRLPENLGQLGPPKTGPATAQAAGLIDEELAEGSKAGYSFRYVIAGSSNLGAPAKFELAAVPLIYGTTGRRSFYRDSGGEFHAADHQGALATPADPRVE